VFPFADGDGIIEPGEDTTEKLAKAAFEDVECFDISYPVRVSGRSFLSQLI